MSESYYGAFCNDCGEMVAVNGFSDGEMIFEFPKWQQEKVRSGRTVRRLKGSETGKSGPCKCIERKTHTFTDTELARLVEVACREQRYECVNYVHGMRSVAWGPSFADAMRANTPAPTLEQVMEKYKANE